MLALAFDTTSSGFSIALLQDKKLLAETVISESGKQSEWLVLEIEKLLKSQSLSYSNIDLIAATNGPGSFTGTRIGSTCAKTIKLAINKDLIFVSTLEAAAFECQKEGKILTVIDAGNDEIFIAEFLKKDGNLQQLSKAKTINRSELENNLPQDEFYLLEKQLSEISAKSVGLLALEKFCNHSHLENQNPLYLRDPKIGVRKK